MCHFKQLPNPVAFEFSVDEVSHFATTSEILPNSTKRVRLYVPINRINPGWDLILDTGVHTAFFQLSVSLLEPEKFEKFKKSFNTPTSSDEGTPALPDVE